MSEPTPGTAVASDGSPAITDIGRGDVVLAVVSMSMRSPDGQDAAYLRWHLLDHLPEQHRIEGLRLGQRWVSTPACRAARIAAEPPFDEVDHLVTYLFAEPVALALERFFALGAALRGAGRMPLTLPRVQLGAWEPTSREAAPRVRTGADVLPWRPARGVFVLVEPRLDPRVHSAPAARAALAEITGAAGVAGWWQYAGTEGHHARLDPTGDLVLTVCFLDEEPHEVAPRLASALARRWRDHGITPLLATPFAVVEPWHWDRPI